MTAAEKLQAIGMDDVVIFEAYSYDDALVGVTERGRAVYDYDKMVAWLIETQGMARDEAMEWIEYNTIGALKGSGPAGPIILFPL